MSRRLKHYHNELDILDNHQEDALWKAVYGNGDALRKCIASCMETKAKFRKAAKKQQSSYTIGMMLHYSRVEKIMTDLLIALQEFNEKSTTHVKSQ